MTNIPPNDNTSESKDMMRTGNVPVQSEQSAQQKNSTKPTRWSDKSFNDLVNSFFGDTLWSDPFPQMLGKLDRAFFPRVDVSETPSEIRVVADIPGVNDHGASPVAFKCIRFAHSDTQQAARHLNPFLLLVRAMCKRLLSHSPLTRRSKPRQCGHRCPRESHTHLRKS